MTPIQQLLLGVGASKKTYMDDVFSTYIYNGTGSSGNAISNGINLSEEGGLVWVKNRGTSSRSHILFDSEIGDKYLRSNVSNTADDFYGQGALNSSGFTVGGDWGTLNASGENFSSWTFRKAPGFFDVVKYTGNDTNRTIAHSLGCVPGMILIKGLDAAHHWQVYHRGVGNTKVLKLNDTDAASTSGTTWNNTSPTATHFSLGTEGGLNTNNQEFVAYLFAGGESTAATARSVDVDSGDYLSIPDDTGWALGQTWTIEAWVKPDALASSYNTVVAQDGNWYFSVLSDGTCQMHGGGGSHNSASGVIKADTWTHMAYVSNSGTGQWYINGVASGSTASKNITDTSGTLYIGNQTGSSWPWDGKISNLRIVKGTAVYTSSFRTPTEPLTNITNTVLLCCNNSSVTGSTVSPGTITNSSTTANTDSPFDDPAAFTFGDSKEGIIKCGSYVGNGLNAGPEIFLGFEPQWILVKNSDQNEPWAIFDCMRGIVTGGDDPRLLASASDSESSSQNYFDLTSTGFKITYGNDLINPNGGKVTYLAIRRPDVYVGKPAEAGTDVFAMGTTTGNSGDDIDSGFPVDFGLAKRTATAESWYTSARLMDGKHLYADTTAAEASNSYFPFDNNVGWTKSLNSGYQGWMWKRHAGFDVVTFKGDEVSGRQIPHSLGKVPEMMWVKNRSTANKPWNVYHKGLNGGSDPQGYYIELDNNGAEAASASRWNSTAPSSTHFTLGNSTLSNTDDENFIAMLFASVNGISKVGSYTGNGSTQTITTGFSPRFILFKNSSSGDSWSNWYVYDTSRGIPASGTVNYLLLNKNIAEEGGDDLIDVSSTGFTINVSYDSHNGSGESYIYYAHA